MTADDETPAGPAAGTLLQEMGALRRRARRTRQAYWFPLVLFGLIEIGAAPFYYVRPCPAGELCTGRLVPGYFHLGRWYIGEAGELYALLASMAGLGLTVWWYRRHARQVGVHTGTRGPLLAWTGTTLAVFAVSAVPFVFLWVLRVQSTAWLLSIAAGMLALAWAERSALLGTVAALHAVAAGLGVFYNPENQLYNVLSVFGVSDAGMPFTYGQMVNVLLPGVVLLLGGLLALALNRRRAR